MKIAEAESKNKEKADAFKKMREESFEKRYSYLSRVAQSIVKRDAKAHRYTYASLPQILEQVSPYFQSLDLYFYQNTKLTLSNDEEILNTKIFCIRDPKKSFDSSMLIRSPKDYDLVSKDGSRKMSFQQAMGCNYTYSRRYALILALGICPDKDDDASYGANNPIRPIA